MNSRLFVVIALVAVFGKSEAGPIGKDLRLIATVEGKSYYIDDDYKNWFGAEAYCRAMGMSIGDFTSAKQVEALADAFVEENLRDKFYWTAGKDSEKLSQFAWSNSGDEIDPSYLRLAGYMSLTPTCLYFDGKTLGRSTCSDGTHMGALCQKAAS